MSNKTKRKKNNKPAIHGKQNQEKNHMADEIRVHGAIEVHPSQNSIEAREAERVKDESYKKATKDYESRSKTMGLLTFIVTSLYLGATIGIFLQTQNAAQSTSRQMKDFEIVQAARITFENFQAKIIPGKEFAVDGTITLRNNGSTVADEISFQYQWGFYNLEYNPNPTPAKGQQLPKPDLGGFSLGPNQTRTFQIRTDQRITFPPEYQVNIPGLGTVKPQEWYVSAEEVESGKLRYYINPTACYRDAFGQPHIEADCLTYVPDTKSWTSCPNLRQHQ